MGMYPCIAGNYACDMYLMITTALPGCAFTLQGSRAQAVPSQPWHQDQIDNRRTTCSICTAQVRQDKARKT
jgi:hypothetical protein